MEELIQSDLEYLEERYGLAMGRILEIRAEETVPAPFAVYFKCVADFLLLIGELRRKQSVGELEQYTLQQWQELNYALYAEILPEHYDNSYGNPAYAVRMLGETYGRMLSFLYAELRGLPVYVFEGRLEEQVVHLELFLQIYHCFEQEELPPEREIQQILYWFASDYSELFVAHRVREGIDPELDFAVRIVMDSDLEDLRYLYRYGEYVTANELETARFLNTLPEETVAAMADVYTEGYRKGFALGGKDLSRKRTVNIRYTLGFERMIRLAVRNFEKMGLKPVIYRAAVSVLNRRMGVRIGYLSTVPNRQFEYDHREDCALFLDKRFLERKLSVMRTTYEKWRELAAQHAGPAVVETFGEAPFSPEANPDACALSLKQQKLLVWESGEVAQITNHYIIGKERSFTAIAFPIPAIGAQFAEIFRETVRINTLDYVRYQQIQQHLIDALDQGTSVHIAGKDGNCTDLVVALMPLRDASRETLFENCVADVNIPVGEVFTSPKLAGTNGVLHVKRAYLDGLRYENLRVQLTDGMVTGYGCGNFAGKQENQKYFFENVMFRHDTLPLGEFAIGTNTAAYAMAKRYGIGEKLPILIAEKMGPHFALGDTCYCWAEDTAVFNPDGKEMIARENEVSALRSKAPEKAYFGCHTDITIPYEELGFIEVVCADGRRIPVIEDGRFVLAGTEILNEELGG